MTHRKLLPSDYNIRMRELRRESGTDVGRPPS